MNTFNDVFVAVKKYCDTDAGSKDVKDCFGFIAFNANVPPDNLDFYLNVLQDLGLIKYSRADKTIHLTGFGKMQKRLFA